MGATIQLEKSSQDTLLCLTEALARHAFRVVRSFDLQQATLAHSLGVCPVHGEQACTCQYLLLMVYPISEDQAAMTIALHGHDELTSVTLVEGEETAWLNVILPLAINHLERKDLW